MSVHVCLCSCSCSCPYMFTGTSAGVSPTTKYYLATETLTKGHQTQKVLKQISRTKSHSKTFSTVCISIHIGTMLHSHTDGRNPLHAMFITCIFIRPTTTPFHFPSPTFTSRVVEPFRPHYLPRALDRLIEVLFVMVWVVSLSLLLLLAYPLTHPRFQVKLALQSSFPDYDVLEFTGSDSLRQQLEMFATAAMVVAPHGAGLSNILVAPLHTPVLEIAPISCPPCFLRLALKVRRKSLC